MINLRLFETIMSDYEIKNCGLYFLALLHGKETVFFFSFPFLFFFFFLFSFFIKKLP
jgi:hypothetical protein